MGAQIRCIGECVWEMVMTYIMNIHEKILIYLLALMCVSVSLYGCSRDHHDHPNLITGAELYTFHCAECHGEEGTGKLFDGIPASILTQKNPQEIITYLTAETNHDRKMPVFKTMPTEEARLITNHLLQLQTQYDPKTSRKPPQFLIKP